jgi:hypothetical protein
MFNYLMGDAKLDKALTMKFLKGIAAGMSVTLVTLQP